MKHHIVNIILALNYGAFASAHWINFLKYGRASALLAAVFECLLVIFFLVRKRSRQTSNSFADWVLAIGGTNLPFFLRPAEPPDNLLIGHALQLSALILMIGGSLSLNLSFGIVPANRGIKTGGLYRFVRHPLYTSYFMKYAGYLVNNLTQWNLFFLLCWSLLQIGRIRAEEKFLSLDPGYRRYMEISHWRLVPHLY